MSTRNVVLGSLAGLAIGAIAGILFAPEKGSKTRKQVIDKGNDFVDKAKSKYDEIRDSVAETIKSAKNDASNLADKGKARFDETKKDLKDAASNLKNNVAADFNAGTS